MARPQKADRDAERARCVALLRRRLAANTGVINAVGKVAKTKRTVDQKKSLRDAKEENAFYWLILDIAGLIDNTDITPDVAE